MKRGGKVLVSTAIFAVAACGSDGKLQVRSLPTPLGSQPKPLSVRVAQGQAELRLGNTALALESFRKANRDDPNNIEALAGMAVCYDQMGRFDVSRRYYEAALALEPANTELLALLANSLQAQGLTDQAGKVRQEMAARTNTAPALAVAAPKLVEKLAPAPATAASELALRPAGPAAAPEIARFTAGPVSTAPNLPAALVASNIKVVQDLPEPTVADIPRPELEAEPVRLAAADVPAAVPVNAPVEQSVRIEEEPASTPAPAPVIKSAALGPSVTIKLPPARRVESPPVVPAAARAPGPAQEEAPITPPQAPEPTPVPQYVALPEQLKAYARPVPRPTFAENHEPRLERLSMGEIALITASKPVWRATTLERTAQSTAVRYVPLREASTLPTKVRLLNAARVDRLAARTRAWLAARGWRGMGIGDATATRQASVILYPADKQWLAQRLRAQFGFATQRASVTQVTVLLGSDAARHPALRRRG
ncbi:LytR C-terminal domain-containing protein [Sphingomonas sp. SM33]|uniref:LytR C-terminal domain-containing protein n=1 Tax=Sphingomonas telluris TaxID=2907998 RepID=A0ABS9VIH7_9SPHN|nr:LytR C-terminal domain-containing protein [Sphingomonas telluris]MCH8614773.1 LytR C-terminal domain-containing protein [Sphingomonas telluris]